MKAVLVTGAYRGLGHEVARQLSGRNAITCLLAADAPQDKTGLFWRDRQVIPW